MPRHGEDDAQTGLLAGHAVEQSIEVSTTAPRSPAATSQASCSAAPKTLPGGKVRTLADWEELRRLNGVPKRGGHPQSFEPSVPVPPWLTEAIAAQDGGILPQGDATSNFFSRGGLRLHYRKWTPARSSPKGVVLFQHGMGGHCSGPALRRVGEALAAAGLACYMLDLQAHGYSEGHGPPVQTVLDYHDMLSDMEAMVQLVTEQVTADAKIVVAGESLGGALAALLSVRMQQRTHPQHANWAGYFGVAPAFDPAMPPRPLELALRMCCLPCCPRSTVFSPPAPGDGDETGENGPPGAMVLEQCHELLDERDPLSWKSKFPLVTGGTFIDLCRDIKGQAHTLSGPFRILQGGDDCVVFPAGAREFMGRSQYVAAELAAGRPNPVMMLPEGYRHCLLQDWCADAVVEHLVSWCVELLDPASTVGQQSVKPRP
jgi:pimeloyl-ACP methyl ester carboxylesterase